MGEQEVRDALLAKAEFLTQLGDKEGATKAFEATEGKTSGVGNKMDLVFSQIRYAKHYSCSQSVHIHRPSVCFFRLLMFYEDWRGVKKLLAKAKLLCDQGGDWERKNKLKVSSCFHTNSYQTKLEVISTKHF
jgi:26S proteasome regulatory subunit N7